MILKDINVDQVTLLLIECDCGHEIIWPVSVNIIECVKCGRKEIWNEDLKIEYPDIYRDYEVIKNKIK